MERSKTFALLALLIAGVVLYSWFSKPEKPAASQPDSTQTDASKDRTSGTSEERSIRRDTTRTNATYKPIDHVFMSSLPKDRLPPIQKEWTRAIAAEGFKTVEFRFDRGYIKSVRNDPKAPQTAVWPDASGSCQLEVQLVNLVPNGASRVACYR